MDRIYLDSAATSWPKPEPVYVAVDHYLRHLGAPAGRSGYAEAAEVSRLVELARREVARLLGVRETQRLIFTFNGTDALNMAISGMVNRGDHVVTTFIEHNSTLRPLRALEEAGVISVTRVHCDVDGVIQPSNVFAAMTPRTRLVVISHASNVTGAIQPVEAIRDITHGNGAKLLVDAAQTVGHLPIDFDNMNADLLAASGHKGLLGPLGTGVLCLRPEVEKSLRATRQGGTGTQSDQDRQPQKLPYKYESGNLNVPGILGLGAAASYLSGKTIEAVREHELTLTRQLIAGLSKIRKVRIFGSHEATKGVGLVSVTVEGYDPQEVAAALDAAHRIQVRPGLHCAPHMHQALGTIGSGGTVRFSLSWFNTQNEIDKTIAAMSQLAAASS
jgi:cysteine desulfurase/selenocysteine lyase